jgi:hypothetical protein
MDGHTDGWMDQWTDGWTDAKIWRSKVREKQKEEEGMCASLLGSMPPYVLFHVSLANFHRKASVIMVDELLSAYPHQLSFSEAGLRIMITSHFPPKTRLSMASRMLINEVSGKA